ncbi:MAG: hypothetical protein RLZZ210_968 [Pseudomonadota bacterium]|jgi:subtilisin family serine protease
MKIVNKILLYSSIGISILFNINYANSLSDSRNNPRISDISNNINSNIIKPVIVQIKDSAISQTINYIKNDSRILEGGDEWGYLSQKMFGAMQNLESKHKFTAKSGFNKVFKGFSADLTTQQINELAKNPAIKSIEPDYVVHANLLNKNILNTNSPPQVIPWGISMINATISSSLAGNNTGVSTGSNVYVIDTGSAERHSDLVTSKFLAFGFRAKFDCNGHGTHVAGTISAIDNNSYVVGVAPSIPLTSIKVLGCNGSGSVSNIVKAIDWVSVNGIKPAVINMSLGSEISPAMDTAVENALAQGIMIVVAAGNSATDACSSSPSHMGRLDGVITVGAVNNKGEEASFSNYGECVDVWAPGVDILSTGLSGGTATMSGTSMASPHVAGVTSLYRAKFPTQSPAIVEQALKNDAFINGYASKDGVNIKIINASNY